MLKLAGPSTRSSEKRIARSRIPSGSSLAEPPAVTAPTRRRTQRQPRRHKAARNGNNPTPARSHPPGQPAPDAGPQLQHQKVRTPHRGRDATYRSGSVGSVRASSADRASATAFCQAASTGAYCLLMVSDSVRNVRHPAVSV